MGKPEKQIIQWPSQSRKCENRIECLIKVSKMWKRENIIMWKCENITIRKCENRTANLVFC